MSVGILVSLLASAVVTQDLKASRPATCAAFLPSFRVGNTSQQASRVVAGQLGWFGVIKWSQIWTIVTAANKKTPRDQLFLRSRVVHSSLQVPTSRWPSTFDADPATEGSIGHLIPGFTRSNRVRELSAVQPGGIRRVTCTTAILLIPRLQRFLGTMKTRWSRLEPSSPIILLQSI